MRAQPQQLGMRGSFGANVAGVALAVAAGGKGRGRGRARRGVLLLEVLVALAILALAGTSLVVALRETAQLQNQLDERLRVNLLISNALEELRALPVLEAGTLVLPNQPEGVKVTAEVTAIQGLLDQFGNPLPLPPGVTSAPILAAADAAGNPTAAASVAGQASGQSGGQGTAVVVPPTLFEVSARIEVRHENGETFSEEHTFWAHPDVIPGLTPSNG